MKLNNKRIVMTGGTSGIGYEMTKYLHPDNELIVISRCTKKLDKLTQKFDGIITYQADLSKLDDIKTVANAIVKRFDTIDILINNAAVQNTPTYLDEEFEYESISAEIILNFTSVCSLTYLLLPILLPCNKAVILNVNSGLGLSPKTSSAIYCGTKGALNIFSQSLRYQLEKTNISVQQVFLDLVDTNMTQGRGKNKISADNAAIKIIKGIERDRANNYVGRVNFLVVLLRLAPLIAKKIMKQH